MNCRNCVELMSEYLDDCLSGGVLRQLEDHLASCERCSSEVESMRGMLASLRDLSGERSPVDCWEHVQLAVSVARPEPALSRWLLRPLIAVPALAAAILAALLFLWPSSVEEPIMMRPIGVPEYSRYISAHSSVQRRQTLVDPDVTFVTAELEKASLVSDTTEE